MIAITLSIRVHAPLETVWTMLMESVESPQKYMPEIAEFRILEGGEGDIVRELTISETLYRERVWFDRAGRAIHRELLDHPEYDGRITARAVPASVQNPMAPVDLQYFLELEPKFLRADGVIDDRTERRVLAILALLKQEQRHLKEKAEEVRESS